MPDQTQDFSRSMTQDMVLAGRYRLTAPLGRGGMGTVWRALHLALDSEVAVKLVDPELAKTESGRLRFQREAQAAAGIRSPHVVQILDHGVDQGTPYIVMELLEGESLAQRLDRVGKLSLTQTSDVITQVARAMSRAHEAGVVHRDLKPDNIFLVQNDDEEVAKVLDFGIAKAGFGVGPENTKTGAILGTPHYMSPEQLRGEKGLDYRSDLWSLGVIVYECVCGRRPFESDTFPDLVIKICAEEPRPPTSLLALPAAFDVWFTRAVQRAPERRFESARELAQALREVAGGSQMAGAATNAEPAAPLRPPPAAALGNSEAVRARDITQHATAHTQPDLPRLVRRRPLALLALGGVLALAVAALVLRSQGADVAPEQDVGPAVSAALDPAAAALSGSVAAIAPSAAPSSTPDPATEPSGARPALAAAAPIGKLVPRGPGPRPASSGKPALTAKPEMTAKPAPASTVDLGI